MANSFVHRRKPKADTAFLRELAREHTLKADLEEAAGKPAFSIPKSKPTQRFELTFLMADRERTRVSFDAENVQAAKKHACAAFMTERNAIGMRLNLPMISADE